jgi:hypothetical protein
MSISKLFFKLALLPAKLLVIFIGILILPFTVSVEWATQSRLTDDKGWDECAVDYIVSLLSIL